MQDLFKALEMFKSGVQEAATASALSDAQQQVNQIRVGIQDQGQQRQAFQQLSNDLAMRLTGVGANASQVQSAFSAIAPQNFGSAEQLQLEGQLSGNQYYQEQAGNIIGERDAKQRGLLERGHQMDLEKLTYQAMLSQQGKAAGQPLREGELEKIITAQSTLQSGLDLENLVSGKDGGELVGPLDASWVGEKMDNKSSAFMSRFKGFQSRFIKEITGAGVSLEEAERILGTLPDPSYNTKDQFLAKMGSFNIEVKQALGNRFDTLEAAGKDMSSVRANYDKILANKAKPIHAFADPKYTRGK